ncbi:MAG TPA: UDP-glucuronic acid decarboxylase family protein [Hyphomicrobium sp.]|nr:UDP-glucuronic acid decarboxylase family protein [Hyphomicrobium sp.]
MGSDIRPTRVLVAGAAGFIGSHLCQELINRGATVFAVDNLYTGRKENLSDLCAHPRFTFIQADIVDPLPMSVRPDVIFNLACAASPQHYQADPVHTMMTSVVGTRNLLAVAADTGARFILASTSEVYGDPLMHPQKETYFGNVNPTGPRACYDEGKRAAEALAFDYLRLGRVDARVARIFNTYGPKMRSDDGRVVSNMITQAMGGEDITVYGDGEQTRSFCYVSDLVAGLLRLADHDRKLGAPVNLGNPNEMTILELLSEVRALTHTSSRVVRKPLPVDDPKRRKPDISLAKNILGWEPRVALGTGLAQTVAWFAQTFGLAEAPVAKLDGRRKRIPRSGMAEVGAGRA